MKLQKHTIRGVAAIALSGIGFLPVSSARPQAAEVETSIVSPALERPVPFDLITDKSVNALSLAPKLLPPEIAATIVEADKGRQWLPGQAYWIGFWDRGEPVDKDLCRRHAYSVGVNDGVPPMSSAEPDGFTDVGEIERRKEYAIAFPMREASAEACAELENYISLGVTDANYRLAAYRTLVKAMRQAAGTRRLPFTITCKAEGGAGLCEDPRQALATLPLSKLFHIDIDSGSYRTVATASRSRIRVRQPVSPEAKSHWVEFQFGSSGSDGDSWRVSYRDDGTGLEAIELRRARVIYH